MRGSASARPYVSAQGVARLREHLSERDLAILHEVAELRLMSVRQLQQLHFPLSRHGSQGAATRATQRVLKRLTDSRLLLRLRRQIGGVRAGSAGFVLALGPIGQRVLAAPGARLRIYEPGLRHVEHTLAIAQLVVDLQLLARDGALELLECQAEPRSWRRFGNLAGRSRLKPDLYLSIGRGAFELRWFVEVDLATESLSVIRKKCRLYADYYQSGIEQAHGGVFPRVCWIVPDAHRARHLVDLIDGDPRLPERMFVVTTASDATAALGRRR